MEPLLGLQQHGATVQGVGAGLWAYGPAPEQRTAVSHRRTFMLRGRLGAANWHADLATLPQLWLTDLPSRTQDALSCTPSTATTTGGCTACSAGFHTSPAFVAYLVYKPGSYNLTQTSQSYTGCKPCATTYGASCLACSSTLCTSCKLGTYWDPGENAALIANVTSRQSTLGYCVAGRLADFYAACAMTAFVCLWDAGGRVCALCATKYGSSCSDCTVGQCTGCSTAYWYNSSERCCV